MTVRAEAVDRTRQRVLDATTQLAGERFLDEISLEDIAGRAEVSTRTLIRQFGNRANLIRAAFDAASAQFATRPEGTPPDDVGGAVHALFDDYESWGDPLLMLLAQERRHPELLRPLLDEGRADLRAWVERVFSPRDALNAAQLVAVTDVYVWKLLSKGWSDEPGPRLHVAFARSPLPARPDARSVA
jgi:AcrR family transcriptional regulator